MEITKRWFQLQPSMSIQEDSPIKQTQHIARNSMVSMFLDLILQLGTICIHMVMILTPIVVHITETNIIVNKSNQFRNGQCMILDCLFPKVNSQQNTNPKWKNSMITNWTYKINVNVGIVVGKERREFINDN